MTVWCLELLGMFIHVDAQRNPGEAILLGLAVAGLLWFIVARARHREERRAESRGPSDDPPFGRR